MLMVCQKHSMVWLQHAETKQGATTCELEAWWYENNVTYVRQSKGNLEAW